jgi:hypothetical protein
VLAREVVAYCHQLAPPVGSPARKQKATATGTATTPAQPTASGTATTADEGGGGDTCHPPDR